MHSKSSASRRRSFLRTCGVTSAVIALSDLEMLAGLPRVRAADAELPRDIVRFHDEIEPLVRLLEETPRGKVIEVFARRIQSGTSYREVLAALLLAGVRNVEPRPSVGFKFHAVLVVNSAHLASMSSPEQDRWLPIFWALDYFKSAQARDEEERGWTMAPVDEAAVPPTHKARAAFKAAMESWDVSAADAAITGLARSAGSNEIFELLAHYGCRDFRSIGHKAIFVSNAYRTLNCIGWRYAEPVLRSLTYALLNHNGEPNPSKSDLQPDAAWREVNALVGTLRSDWLTGERSGSATDEVLGLLREATPQDAVRDAVRMMNEGIHPQSIIDGIFLSSGELLMRQPGIVSLHSSTSTNALQFAFRTAANDETRQRLLLQNMAFIPYFREAMRGRGDVGDRKIDTFAKQDKGPEKPSVSEIFKLVNNDRRRASDTLYQFLSDEGDAVDIIDSARQLVFLKGNDSHDYKFSSAVLEDYYAISPEHRNAYLAASSYLLPGSGDRDNGLVNRIRGALS